MRNHWDCLFVYSQNSCFTHGRKGYFTNYKFTIGIVGLLGNRAEPRDIIVCLLARPGLAEIKSRCNKLTI